MINYKFSSFDRINQLHSKKKRWYTFKQDSNGKISYSIMYSYENWKVGTVRVENRAQIAQQQASVGSKAKGLLEQVDNVFLSYGDTRIRNWLSRV